jgi:crossover junction endodeoxyribonuclease RusA
MKLRFDVIGLPAPQGSKRHVGHGIMIESSKKVKPWREAVTAAAREAMGGKPAPFLAGPVMLTVFFTLPKPKSAPKSRETYPDKKPDIDKLLRSTMDGLTAAGVWEDDARVILCCINKTFPNQEELTSLDVPGARIVVSEWK